MVLDHVCFRGQGRHRVKALGCPLMTQSIHRRPKLQHAICYACCLAADPIRQNDPQTEHG